MNVRTNALATDIAAGTFASGAVVPVFASTMFLSGFLLFLVEPMTAKMVLPILGGAPMVWNGCVVFFQIVMLAGYGYAFLASQSLPVRKQVLVHACVLAAAATTLPFMIEPGLATPPAGNPLLWLMLLLTLTLGLPFFALSTSASVFQHWLSRTDHPAARDPYFLYSASNHGCLLALASYPIVIEPMLTLRAQTRLWALGYALLVALAGLCGTIAWRRATEAPEADTVAAAAPDSAPIAEPVTFQRRARWTILAFVPSSMMLAVTSYLSTDIAAVPLLWILPLAIYLATFALAFGRGADRAIGVAKRAFPLLVVPLALFMLAGVREPLALLILLHLGGFAAVALNCHGDLANDRPDASRLTEFYFYVSVGGMLGGLFNTLLAPLLFHTIVEYPIILMLASLLFRIPGATAAVRRISASDVVLPALTGALTAAALIARARQVPLALQLAGLSIPALLAFTQRRHVRRFGVCVSMMLAAGFAFRSGGERTLYETRTFFGVYRVVEDAQVRYHGLAHGTTLHGLQALAPERRAEALTYFHATGPFGQAWRTVPGAAGGHSIGVIGLGIGTLATYAGPDQRWTFFEIDPVVERVARTREYFSFMDACGERCRVVIGDARISLGHVAPKTYDLLVLDAFSSDAIPIHLLTQEAIALYLSRLAPGGALMIHVSNRHLGLAPVVARLADNNGLVALDQIDLVGTGGPEGKSSSHWIAMARNARDLGALPSDARWAPLVASAATPLWTDDFSNILSVLHFR